jgi:hypothetical protein
MTTIATAIQEADDAVAGDLLFRHPIASVRM